MKSDRTQRRPNIILCVAAALLAIAPASIVRAADGGDSVRMAGALPIRRAAACNWASANPSSSICRRRRERSMSAIPASPTRSCARRSASIFPASPTARRAFSRWPGTDEELRPSRSRSGATSASCRTCSTPPSPATKFMCARSRTRSSSPGRSRPPRRLRRRSISLTALSTIRRLHPDPRALRSPSRAVRAVGGPEARSGGANGKSNSPRGRVINALTIRGADQVSLRVTVAEIRRDIIKQLGVNLSGSGPNGSFTLDNPFAINGAVAASEAALNWVKGSQNFSANSAGLRATGRRPHARRADRDGSVRRNRKIPGRRHDSHPQQRAVQSRLPVRIHPAALWRDPEFHAGRLVPGTDPTANRNRSHGYRPLDASHVQRYCNPRFPDPQQHDDGGAALWRLGRLRRPHQHAVGAGDQRLSGADESSGARRAVSLAGLSAQRDRAFDHRDALHRARDRSRARSFGPTRTSRTPAIRRPGSLAASTGSIPRRSRSSRCLATPARSDLSPNRPRALRQEFPQTLRRTALMAALPDARPIFAGARLEVALSPPRRLRLSPAAPFPTRLPIPLFPGELRAAPSDRGRRRAHERRSLSGRRRARRALKGEHPRLRRALSALRFGRSHNSDACGNEPKLDSRS